MVWIHKAGQMLDLEMTLARYLVSRPGNVPTKHNIQTNFELISSISTKDRPCLESDRIFDQELATFVADKVKAKAFILQDISNLSN